MSARKADPEIAPRFAIKLDSTTNGEYAPKPLAAKTALALQLAEQAAGDHARKHGISRREFMESTCGAASVLLAMNQVYGCAGSTYAVPRNASQDSEEADAVLQGDELIFDVQTHHVAVDRMWWQDERPTLAQFLVDTPQAKCDVPGGAPRGSTAQALACFDEDHYLKEVFLDSDTDVAVLSALWGAPEMNAIRVDEMARTRERISKMAGAPRLLIQGHVYGKATTPEQNAEQMHALVEEFKIDAWKLYPVWSPDGKGYRMDDNATGARLLDQGSKLGVRVFAIHKGLRVPGMPQAATDALDIGPAALAFPNTRILVYHSAYDSEHKEGPYDPNATTGVDTLIRSCEDAGLGKNKGNVYAELGSVWREVMKDPEQAAHVIGKLIKCFGEDRVLWGTDAIWYGSPQDQIMAFRAFQISEEYQEKFGYPALTQQAKAKIFGLNAAAVYELDSVSIQKAQQWDPVAKAREEYKNDPQPSHATYGPRTRRELLGLQKIERALHG
jgi:predicted TIM-barrel fold metal-dependent hydrolase